MGSSLLPINSTQFERAIEQAFEENTEIPLRTLYDPNTCPVHLLPWLAWAWSVDRWDDRWSETVKRAAIRAAFYVHAYKGTRGALRRVIEPLARLIRCQEWWEEQPPGVPGTFSLEVAVHDGGITEEMYQELERLISDTKPVTRHLKGLNIALETSGYLYLSAATYDGDEMSIYPSDPVDIEVYGVLNVDGREHSIDSLDVFP